MMVGWHRELAHAALSLSAIATLALTTPLGAQDSSAGLPGRRVEMDSASLLHGSRLRQLAPARRDAWTRYLARSRELAAVDHHSMEIELRSVGRAAMSRAPWVRDFSVTAEMTPAWFATDTARRVAESILSYQTPSGGWSKHVDFRAGVRRPGMSYNGETTEWRYIPTIDNSSTTEEIRFLVRADAAHPEPRYRSAVERGVRYLLDGQMPTGCWPQVFPLQGGYHDAVTFNDDALVNVARLMREVRAGTLPVSALELRERSRAAERGAIRCMLDAQVAVRGRLTVWGQQHDPITLRPTSARSYELTSLTGDESVGVARFLMETPDPDARVVRAVHAAADWFRANSIPNIAYDRYQLTRRDDAKPVWARMVEIGTGKPIFANRDGVKLYDYARLTDRQSGYRWFTSAPNAFLRAYERWAKAHPRTSARTRSHPSDR
jgi:PelA/Pel-15E family pectate lyase